MRSPSVTTITFTLWFGTFCRIVKVMAILVGDKDAAGATIDLGEPFAGRAYRRGIDNRHHLFKVVADQAIKQGFVGVRMLQINMFVDFSFEP